MPDVANLTTRRANARPLEVTYQRIDEVETTAIDKMVGQTFSPAAEIRRIPHHIGMQNTPGTYWCATGDRHIGFESCLEMRWVNLLDFDKHVVEIMTQPMTILGIDADGVFSHTPDIFVRCDDGTGRLIDVKHPRAVDQPRTIRTSLLAAETARQCGWDYYLADKPPTVFSSTVAWLSGYRRLCAGDEYRDEILAACEPDITFRSLLRRFDEPVLVLPVVFHLLWHHVLETDYRRRLTENSRLFRGDDT